MKYLILLLSVFFVFISTAQERTVENSLTRTPAFGNYSYYNYEGTSSDVLVSTTMDTIDFVFETKKSKPFSWDVIVTYSPYDGNDTTATIEVLGRNSENESWTSITSSLSSDVNSADVVTSLSSHSSYIEEHIIDTTLTSTALTAESFYVTDVADSKARYRYINVRNIITDASAAGSGIQVENVEFKIWEE